MTIDIVVPTLGESVTEATVAKWFKGPGDAVALDEPLVELETDKVSIEVGALAAGALLSIAVEAGTDVAVGAVLGTIDETKAGAEAAPASTAAPESAIASAPPPAPAPAPVPAPTVTASSAPAKTLSPAVRKLLAMRSRACRMPSRGMMALAAIIIPLR